MRNCLTHTESPYPESRTKFGIEEYHLFNSLSRTAMKTLLYIAEHCVRDGRRILFDKEDAKFEIGFRENKSIYTALTELITKDILAGCKCSDEFYYNPIFINKEKQNLDGSI